MTLQQLRYVTAIAETGTLSEAARRFYIAQPSLTAALRELEEELGLTIFRRTNRGAVLRKVIREHDLQFTPLFTAKPHVFVSAASPLAGRAAVTLDDLAPYPRLSYEQGEHNAFYFSEEILSTRDSKKDILVSDRATLFNLLIGLNGYTICSGVISEALNGPNIVAVPLQVDDTMQIGCLTHKQVQPGVFGKRYIEILSRKVGTT